MLLREATPALILTLASAAPAFLLLFWRAFFTLNNCQQQSSWLPSSWGCGLGRGLCAYAGGELAPDQSLSLVLIALAAIALVCGGGSDLYRVLVSVTSIAASRFSRFRRWVHCLVHCGPYSPRRPSR